MIRVEGVSVVAKRMADEAMKPSVQDLTTEEHEAFARLDAWMASALSSQAINAAAVVGRTHR